MGNENPRGTKENSRQFQSNSYPNYSTNNSSTNASKDSSLKGALLLGLIGATATTFAVSSSIPLFPNSILSEAKPIQFVHLRRSIDWCFTQLRRSQQSSKGENRNSFKEEAWKRYNRRMQEAYEEEMERVERIRRMQSVFNRERNKYKKSYESWRESGGGTYNQHFQRDDWYWKSDNTSRNQWSHYNRAQRDPSSYPLSHHYSVLGLDRCRKSPYTEAEIKSAFRAKAKEFHPDQNQDNKEVAEAKFKEVMVSYEAIKIERKNSKGWS